MDPNASRDPEFGWNIPRRATKRRIAIMSVVVLLACGTWAGISYIAAVASARAELHGLLATVDEDLGIDTRVATDPPGFIRDILEPILGPGLAGWVEDTHRLIRGYPSGESLPDGVREPIANGIELYYGRKARARGLAVLRILVGLVYVAVLVGVLRTTRTLNAHGRVRLEDETLSARAPVLGWIGPLKVRRIPYECITHLTIWRGLPRKGVRHPEMLIHFKWGWLLLRSHLAEFEELVGELADRAGLEEVRHNWFVRLYRHEGTDAEDETEDSCS
jgi:hypothetical protein